MEPRWWLWWRQSPGQAGEEFEIDLLDRLPEIDYEDLLIEAEILGIDVEAEGFDGGAGRSLELLNRVRAESVGAPAVADASHPAVVALLRDRVRQLSQHVERLREGEQQHEDRTLTLREVIVVGSAVIGAVSTMVLAVAAVLTLILWRS